ncbi:MBL fold metallo-hydrolase [Orrella sp. 11846]|uniref:MBL fold metallo-hydrolase n=1 Tax=Orrella sp. 11846 TaxID=3409913 RepID=UPI003B5909C0
MDTQLKLDFLGAAGTVTGSKTLIRDGMHKILIDCGLFQGFKNLRLLNWAQFPFDVRKLDAVVLTHAHLDHSGALPLLVKEGYQGPIYASKSTIDVCEVLLKDSAKLQEEEAEYANRHKTTKHAPAKPLYNSSDVAETLKLFEPLTFHEKQEILPNVNVTLQYAGHILGAASVRIHIRDQEILFSGDLGRADAPIMMSPEPVGDADYVVMESTYGNRPNHHDHPEEELAEIINETVRRGGAILIPSFAVGRAQMLLHAISSMKQRHIIGQDIPVFLDSPMAVNLTQLYEKHHEDHRFSRRGIQDIFDVAHMVRTVEESKQLNAIKFPRIIISASGMATGGRVLHHLRTLVTDHRNSVVFAGFQAGGTRGARMVSGEPTVRVFGEELPVRAAVHCINGFSAHADASQLLDWLRSASSPPRRVFLNHGEPTASDTLRQRIERELQLNCCVPLLGEQVVLG